MTSNGNARSGVERNGINVIAEDERYGRAGDLFFPWFAANASVLGLSYGAWLSAFGGSLRQSVLAIFLGVLASFLLVGMISLAGQRGSAPTMTLSRSAFGPWGNLVPTAVAYLSLIGWEIVLISIGTLMARTVARRIGAGDGSLAMAATFVTMVIIVMASGIRGFPSIMRIQSGLTWATGVLTIGYLFLVADHIHPEVVLERPEASVSAMVGLFVFCLTSFGLSWASCAADYSRYLPRRVSGKKVVSVTVFGGSLPILALVMTGLFLSASDRQLAGHIASDPIGALTGALPTWYVLPFAMVALLGLLSGAILDIYSSGLTLLNLGLPLKRWQAVAVDGALMMAGSAYMVWFAPGFLTVFQAFLLALGVPLAAWIGVFLADFAQRQGQYPDATAPEEMPHRNRLVPLVLMALGTTVGWGLVTNPTLPVLGFLLPWFGDPEGHLARSGAGVLIAMSIGFLGSFLIHQVSSCHRLEAAFGGSHARQS
ncbi:purine-cytosine permease family protein [Austwickia chelonae]|uniref:purine-cytosine permease family protein n=1 Tax=Austwickia chelonae TaxID=100225 RepID=UPI0013C2AEF5|nr:cytosine permease [Austwickia chelonae]